MVVSGCGAASEGTLRVGLLADCVGNLSGVQESAFAGAELPLIRLGARLAGTRPSQGLRDARIAGHPLRVVVGCSESGQYSTLVDEARRLVEVEHVDAVIGPIGAADGIVLRELARRYPTVPFLLADSIAQEATLERPAANVFRFTMDVVQRSAGLGTYAARVLGWKRAVVVSGDDAIGWGGAAGFVAEFCAAGGTVIRATSARALPPADGVALLSSSDFASGAALVKQLASQQFDWKRRLLVGPFALAYDQGLVAAIAARGGGVVAVSSTAPEGDSPAVRRYVRAYAKAFGGHPPGLALDTFAVPYEVAMQALVQAVQVVQGRLGEGRLALRRALTRVVLDGPEGSVGLDVRRQAVGTNYLVRIGSPLRLVARVPRVDQTFGGLFSPGGPPPSATHPVCRPARPPAWAAEVTAAASR
jgi:branched-chain amino acid transport system substrate-binding protein